MVFMEGVNLALVFLTVFLNNLIPFFGPPTWTVLSFLAIVYPINSFPLFILTALCAATLGRFFLASFAQQIIRNRLLGKKYKHNMNHLKKYLGKKPKITFMIFLVEAFTPLPSDQFFIAYGLTGLKLRYALIPFFIGRIFTYSFWVYTATRISQSATNDPFAGLSFVSTSAIILVIAVLLFLYFFIKLDWELLITRRKLKLLK